MPDWSRRRALHAVGTVTAVALAGCSSDSRDRSGPHERRGDPVTDYDLRIVRDADGGPLFWRGERETDKTRRPGGYAYVSGESELSEVTFAPGIEAAGELAAFASATDFDAQSVLLFARPIGECYEPKFRGIRREDGGLHISVCRQLRSADESCARDSEDTVGIGVRVPFPDEEFTSFGSRWSGDCGPRPVEMDSRNGSVDGGGGNV